MAPFGWGFGRWSAMAALLTSLALLPLAINGAGFYFIDDFQALFMPVFLEIGRQLAHGAFPFIHLKAWLSGSIAGEYGYAVFNPVVLSLCTIFYLFFENLNYAAAVWAVFHIVLFGLGVFAACGSLRCRFAESAFAAVAAASGAWLIYWAAMSWTCTAASLAWFAWAVAALFRLEDEPRWLPGSAALVAMTLLSGAPHTDVAMAAVLGLLAVRGYCRSGWKVAFVQISAAVGGAMLAAPALLPLIAYHAASMRPSSDMALLWWVPPWAFAAIGLPVFFSLWQSWGHLEVPGLPIVYLDWAVPIILLQAWRRQPEVFRDDKVRWLGFLSLAFLLLCMFPNVTTVRYSFRFLPMFLLFLMLLATRILTVRRLAGSSGLGWDWRLVVMAIAPAVLIGGGWALLLAPYRDPSIPARVTVIGLFIVLAAVVGISMWLLRPARPAWMLTAVHCIVFAGIVTAWPGNPSLPRWNMPRVRHSQNLDMIPAGNSLWLRSVPTTWYDPFDSRYGALGPLYFGISMINGYSTLGSAAVDQFFDFDPYGHVLRDPLPRLFSTDPATGDSYADLVRIQSIVTGPRWIAVAARTVPAGWTRAELPGDVGVAFRRPPVGRPLPGTLSFLPKGVEAKLLSFSDRREIYQISTSPKYDRRPIVFARPLYPGYRVYLNGRSVPYQRVGGLLPGVVPPASFSGILEIAYLPAGFRRGCLLAGLGIMGLLLLTLRAFSGASSHAGPAGPKAQPSIGFWRRALAFPHNVQHPESAVIAVTAEPGIEKSASSNRKLPP